MLTKLFKVTVRFKLYTSNLGTFAGQVSHDARHSLSKVMKEWLSMLISFAMKEKKSSINY